MRLALAFLVLFPVAAFAQADPTPQFRLLVEVRDAETNEPLLGAHVGANDLLRVSNSQGRVLFEGLPAGEVALGAAYIGYTPTDTTLTLARSSRVTFLLSPEAVDLPEVEVEADKFNAARLARSGFYRRQETRAGTFLTIEDLERNGAQRFSDIFRGITGIRIEREFGQTTLVSTRRRNCSPSIFFDGIEARGLAEQVDTVPLDGVLAVEIYKGPSEIPPEYMRNIGGADCGAILVWTRAR